MNSCSWYEKNIEESIRPLVKLLRNNGINTTCSCGHEMYCECEYYGGPLENIFNLLVDNEYGDFKIEVCMGISDGMRHYKSLTIWLPKSNGKMSEFAFHYGSK